MKASLGILGVALGASAAGLGIVTLARGLWSHDDHLLTVGRRFLFAVLAAAAVAAGAMEWALLTHDFSLRYVAENNARATPLLFTVTGLWAALEGSILLWTLVLGGYLAYMAHRFRARATDPVVAWANLVGLVVALFFFALMLGPANPFRTLSSAPADGRGPNALLQDHPLMAFHPPLLYLGLVGFTVPFAFAAAALITGRFGEGWLEDTRRSTLFAWGCLGVGIILGAWWSYEVLGWGGFWAWDPVENAALLPWLTATAFLHSVIVQERRGMLRVWNLSLVLATFCLTILATFLTRSGVLNSVHSFTESGIGPWLLVFLAIVAAVGVGLIAWRGDRLRSPGRIDAPVSRESAFLVNNLLFAGLAFVVLLGTVYPLLAEALQGRQLSVGEPYFSRMTTPLGIALLLLMAVAPALPWRASTAEVLRRRLIVPAYAGAATMLVALALGTRGVTTVLAFGLAAFAVAGVARQFVVGVAARRRAEAERWPRALRRTVGGNPRLYGGLVVHVGVVCIALALAGFGAFTTKREVQLARGQSATVSGYRLTYVGSRTVRSAQKTSVKVLVAIHHDGSSLGVYAPAISTFPNTAEGIGTPSVRSGLLRDVYLTVVSTPNQRGRVTIGVGINAMVVWLWIGGGVVAVGTGIALSPRLRRRARLPLEVPARDPVADPRPEEPEVVPV
ncbi:MAG TPA: cytochrome c-type biogenesis CcmF C-terminal domain-containing protein [Acidimicrobiia bacterium]|nr:cytochrome c-type biogenesis CcmF C-terminal domain-containing protein [Acidimicrobiia bacterium]